MPELPEVEVICRGLRPYLLERTITAIRCSGKALRQPVPIEAMEKEVVYRTITTIERRAKYLQISLDSGAMLIVHLGMTGNLGVFPRSQKPAKHDHVIFSLDNGEELRYHDVRRFGFMIILPHAEVENREETVFKTSGPEPFGESFTALYLASKAKGKDVAVKPFIMNSQVVVGIGNIYANESLYAAGIRPTRKVKTLTKAEWKRLVAEIIRVLHHAIECGGSTISDFLNASQERGYFQMNFKVYGKSGEKCPLCESEIKQKKIIGRASFYCPQCQG